MLTLGYFTTLVGVEPSHELVSSPLKVEIQANIGFVKKKSIHSFGLGFSGFHEM